MRWYALARGTIGSGGWYRVWSFLMRWYCEEGRGTRLFTIPAYQETPNSILATRTYRASSQSIPPHSTYKLLITQQNPDVEISPSRARTIYI